MSGGGLGVPQVHGMARRTRCPDAGEVLHVFNRAVGRLTIFAKDADYAGSAMVDDLRRGPSLRRRSDRGVPYGNPDLQQRTVRRLGLESAMGQPGRPKNPENA